MICPSCERTNPADARFCIYCATRLTPEPPIADAAPATGATMRFDQNQTPAYSLPNRAPAAASAPAAPSASRSTARHRKYRNKDAGGAVFLIGLGMLILTGHFWPGILALMGVTNFVNEAARGRQQKALPTLLFMVGLSVLFSANFVWPGILILLGIMALFGKRGWRSC